MRRYRIRTKQYLCLTPEEAVTTGITLGEQTIEELALVSLVQNPGFGYHEYAALRTEPEKELRNIPVLERAERSFSSRSEAVQSIRNSPPGTYELCGVESTRIVARNEVRLEPRPGEETPIEDILGELQAFDRKPKKP
jgi:hypothetical protein